MNFAPTEDRRMLADTLDRFVRDKYPFATRDRIAKSPKGFSPEIWHELAELGTIGALFSEADGGFGGAGFDIAVVFESLGRGLVVEPFHCAVLAGGAIAAAGNSAQKQWIGKIIAGESIAAFAHGEPDAHYTLAHVQTRATQAGSDWVLSGAKAVVQHGESAECSWFPLAPPAPWRMKPASACFSFPPMRKVLRCAAIRPSTAVVPRS